MQYITLTIAIFAAALAFVDLCFIVTRHDMVSERFANLALKVAELEKAQKEDKPYLDMSARWDEGINNMMEYQLRGYGLNTDFLKKDGDSDG